MFTMVQAITSGINRQIKYVTEAKASKDNHEEDVYSTYIEKMKRDLNARLEILRNNSIDEKLIKQYEAKVVKCFKNI